MNSINNSMGLCWIIYILIFKIISLEGKTYTYTESDFCNMHDGRRGECVPFRECSAAKKLIQAKIHPNICRFEGLEPVICCERTDFPNFSKPTESTYNLTTFKPIFVTPVNPKIGSEINEFLKGKKAKKSCENYWPETLGITPTSSLIEEFPYFAALAYNTTRGLQRKCSGSLISEKFILTAAYCVANDKVKVDLVRLGSADIYWKDFGEPQQFKVIQTYRHPDYKVLESYNSLALLELNKPVKITKYVKPACLQVEDDIFPNPYLVAIGWSKMEVKKVKTEQMIKYPKFIEYSHAECRRFYPENPYSPKGVDRNTQYCAGKEGEICNRDLGSPLQTRLLSSDGYSVVGVAIYGKSCNASYIPAGYLRVSNYIDWIESIVWPN